MWKFLNLWFVFHQSQPHVFSVSTEGASLACYNIFFAQAQTELALFMAILSDRKAISGVAFSAQAYFTARRPAPFQVVNLMIRRGKEKKNLFFSYVFRFHGYATSWFQSRWWLTLQAAKMEISTLSRYRYRRFRERASQRKAITLSACAKIRRKCFVYFNVN